MAECFIGLGSNIGPRRLRVAQALRAISRVCADLELSPLLEYRAVGPVQPPFLNGVVRCTTALAPRALLDTMLDIELALGRARGMPWGPRTIDLDLLSYDRRVVNVPGLKLPHPGIALRRFVLEPWAHLTPRWMHPELRVSIEDLLRRVGADDLDVDGSLPRYGRQQ